MKQTKDYIFYQTNKAVWLCEKEQYWRYCYEKEITPYRFALVKCTQEWIEELFSILACNKQQFIDIVKEELNRNFLTVYQN